MDTRVEWQGSNHWSVVTADDKERSIGFVREGRDRPDDFSVTASKADPLLLADLEGRRYSSLAAVAEAIGAHLEGACRIT